MTGVETPESAPLADWELELLGPGLPETLTLNNRCERCGAASLHAYIVNAVVMTFCNHHAREAWPILRYCDYRDYRHPVEEAKRLNAESLKAYKEAEAKAQAMRGVTTEPNYRPIPLHETRWDLAYWEGR